MKKWRQRAMIALLTCMLVVLAGCSNSGTANYGEQAAGSDTQSGAPVSPSGNVEGTGGTQGSQSEASTDKEDGEKAVPSDSGKPSDAKADSGSNVQQKDASMGLITAMRLIDKNSGWVGGEGWIARTDDGGENWVIQYEGEKAQTVKQLFALNGKQAWVVLADSTQNSGDRLLATTDGGKHWLPVGRMPNEGFLHFISANEGFAANAHTIDGGRTWTKLDIPHGTVGDAYFHDAKNGWAVTNGDKRFFVKRTTDSGKTWAVVMARETMVQVNGTVIRSAGSDDAWIELIGDSGMTQTGYSLFHTTDGGATWLAVLHNKTAGAGPGPGFSMEDPAGPSVGSAPGPLDVVSPMVAYMGGFCGACDAANSVGWTTDGGKTFKTSKAQYPGYAGAYLMMADSKDGWWICSDRGEPSVLYTTADGGATWQRRHTF